MLHSVSLLLLVFASFPATGTQMVALAVGSSSGGGPRSLSAATLFQREVASPPQQPN